MRNPKYKANKKNGGIIPAVSDTRAMYIPVGCQKCIECRKQKTRQWQVRLTEDLKTNKNAHFVTLTFSTESLKKLSQDERVSKLQGYALDNGICTLATRLTLERWRKHNKKSLRHWMITELGSGTWEHVHIHGIIWTDKPQEIKERWGYGNVVIRNYVSTRTINYIVKYMKKTDIKHKTYEPKMLTSAGIGENYTKTHNAKNNKFNGINTKETYTTQTGHQMAMPAYWRNKIYTDEEREKLWMNKLNEQTRYVLGKKIDISENEKDYNAAIIEARLKNKRLGYGDDEKTWSLEEYEKQRRNLIHEKRLNKKWEKDEEKQKADLYLIGYLSNLE